jgi:riboflavin synthase
MFTGLVQAVGRVQSMAAGPEGGRLEVEASLGEELAPGDSILVSGVCLTAIDPGPHGFCADLSTETLERSTLGSLAPGDAVNLELALRAADRLGGHRVQGHVDAVAQVASATPDGAGMVLTIEAPAQLLRYVVEKGSITVDGVSLTVTQVDERGFGVSLIPETLERTSLTHAKEGTRVNLEVDVLAKYVEKLVSRS